MFYQLISLNVAVNSYDNALLSLLVSNQFVEIKGSVFKKFEKDNEKRGSVVTGEAAKVLALDSSVCGCVHYARLHVVAER